LISSTAVAAVIPAYNEAGGIGNVLSVLRQVEQLTEILVVDDGSTDTTVEQARRQAGADRRIRILRHPVNLGKGQAIFTAWRATRATVLLTLDADLINLTPDQVRELILPVVERRADMTLGLFCHGQWQTEVSHRLTPWLTGQRCFRADLMKKVSDKAAAGYGVETALTVAARKQNLRILRVSLHGVTHPPSEMHRGLWKGVWTRARMYGQIARAWIVASRWQGVIARLKEWTTLGMLLVPVLAACSSDSFIFHS
jgi:glycosyltransferase involved in cell wall biosynthesis